MSAALHQIVIIFISILVDFICRKCRVLSEEATVSLSNIVVKIILPFYLFSSILKSDTSVDTNSVFLAFAFFFGMFLLSDFVAIILLSLLHAPANDRGVYLFETMCGNVTYRHPGLCSRAGQERCLLRLHF